MIYLSTPVRALPHKDEMGTWGLSVKRVGGGVGKMSEDWLAVLSLPQSCQEARKALEMHHFHHYA